MTTTLTKIRKLASEVLPKSDPIPNWTDELKKEIYNLSPLIPEKDKKKARQDKRLHKIIFKSGDKVPTCLMSLVRMCGSYVPHDDNEKLLFHITYVASMYRAFVEIDPPKDNTIGRFLFNIGYNEIFDISHNPVGNNKLQELLNSHGNADFLLNRSIFISADNMMALGAKVLSDSIIRISSNPPREKPRDNPMSQQTQPFIRFPGQKITLVIDLITQKEEYGDIVDKVTKEFSTMSKNDVYGMGETLTGTEKDTPIIKKSEVKQVSRLMEKDD